MFLIPRLLFWIKNSKFILFTKLCFSLYTNFYSYWIHTHTHTHTHIYIYIYIYIHVVHSISFQTFLYRHLKWSYAHENSPCYCYTSYEMTDQFLWLQVQISSYILLKPDCHSWWISKMQSGREEERYAIKLYFKHGKIANRVSIPALSQPGFDPSFGNLACLAPLKSSDGTKHICLWMILFIYIYIYIYIYITSSHEQAA